MNDFERSVDWAVQRGVSRRMVNSDDAFERLVGGTVILCRRMQRAVPTIEPCEVMSILSFSLQLDPVARAYSMITRVLLRNGWSVQQTAQFYENFRNANPEMYDVRLARLLTREQLHATYGNTYGSVMADILVEPRLNPLLYAMFYGNVLEPVDMVYRTAWVPVIFGEDLLIRAPDMEGFNTVAIPALSTSNIQGHYLDYAAAQKLYKDTTGGSLASSLTLSANDHGLHETPQARKAIRQAHRAKALHPQR
jgi:hypothetical protein